MISAPLRHLVLLAALLTLASANPSPDLADKLSIINKQIEMGVPTIPAALAVQSAASAVASVSALPLKAAASAHSSSASHVKSKSSTKHKKKHIATSTKPHSSSTKHKTLTAVGSPSRVPKAARLVEGLAPADAPSRMVKVRRSSGLAAQVDPIAEHGQSSSSEVQSAAAVEDRVDEETDWAGLPTNVKLAMLSSEAGRRMQTRVRKSV